MMGGKIEDGKPLRTLSEIYQSAITDGEEHTFDMVLSASVLQNRDPNNPSTSIPENNELSVSQIVRNEDGGYDVTYRIDDASNTITFHPSECDEDGGDCYEDLDADDQGAQLWNMHSTVGGILSPSDMAEYHHANHLNLQGTTSDDVNFRHRQIFLFGVTTPASNQPKTGTGTYYGWFFGYAHQKDSIDNSDRQRIRGDFHLVANFDLNEPAINGQITNILGQAPGQPSSTRPPWPNSRFEITGTGINDEGQFTATVRGVDDSNAPDIASLRGFIGQLTAQLFGPNAEEIGGVVSADRDDTDHDLSLYGYISGTKFAPKMLGSEGVSVGVDRNYTDSETELQEKSMVTITRKDSGWVVTVNGREVELDDSDYTDRSNYYFKPHGDDSPNHYGEYFWTLYDGFKTPEFEYFDIKGWSRVYDNEDEKEIRSFNFFAHGNRTPVSSLPSTTASYQGSIEGRQFAANDALNSGETTRYRGDLSLTANFAEDSVNGQVTNLQTRIAQGSYTSSQGGATFNATIDGHHFTANDFRGTGAISNLQNGNVYGSFFGPTAQEAGGVFDADLGSDVVVGYFGATQENE